MGWTVLYIAFGVVALWLLGEVLLQYKARLRWRLLAFVGFLGVVFGVLLPSVLVIAVGAIAFALGQTYVTLSFRRGFSTGWALGGSPGESRRRKSGPRSDAPPREPTLEVSDLAYEAADPDPEPVYEPQPLPDDTGQYGVYGEAAYAAQQQQQQQQEQPDQSYAQYGGMYDNYYSGYDQQQPHGPGGIRRAVRLRDRPAAVRRVLRPVSPAASSTTRTRATTATAASSSTPTPTRSLSRARHRPVGCGSRSSATVSRCRRCRRSSPRRTATATTPGPGTTSSSTATDDPSVRVRRH